MEPRLILDTNVIIDLLLARMPVSSALWVVAAIKRGDVGVSVMTHIELFSKPNLSSSESAQISSLLAHLIELPLTTAVVVATIRTRQTHRRKLPDAVIAATALVQGIPLVTRNLADFKSIAGLTVLDPHDPATLPAL